MTTLRSIELQCPVCQTQFDTHIVVALNSFGRRSTDFHEQSFGTPSLPHQVHACTGCGYSASELEFVPDSISPEVMMRVRAELQPSSTMTGSEKYEAAAKVARWQQEEPRRIGDLLLRAAWCAVEEDDAEGERYFRRHAAWKFAEALESYDGVAREDRAMLTYLVGELWRRVGDAAEARQWFDRVPRETTDEAQAWIIDLAAQQRDEPREWFC
jgi:uncharacterized protein